MFKLLEILERVTYQFQRKINLQNKYYKDFPSKVNVEKFTLILKLFKHEI